MKLAKRLSIVVLGLALVATALIGIALLALNTAPGRDWVKGQIEAIEFENGLRIGIESLDDSLYSALTVRGLTLSDPEGVFASVPDLDLEWSPFAFLWGHVDIDSLRAKTATLNRVPVWAETAPSDEPLLPDYTIDIDEFAIERIVVEKAVSGRERIANLEGTARIEDRRADVTLNAGTIATTQDTADGDLLRVALVAVPQDNRLDLDLDLFAPADGVIAAIAGLPGPFEAKLEGQGTWADWKGRLTADWQTQPIARLDVTARDGVFRAAGETQLSSVVPDALQSRIEGPSELKVEVALGERLTQVSARLSGAALTVETTGALALKDDSFEDLRTQITLPGLTRFTSEISSAGLKADIALDGEFSRPKIIYDLRASRLEYAGLGLSGFSTSGETRFDLENMRVPVSARASQVTGLDQATGGPLTEITLTGDLLIQWPRLVSDNLRLQSRRLDADLTLIADAEAGRYGGAIDGQLGDYRLESVGLFDVASGAKVEVDTRAGVDLSGTVKARSTRISNEGLQSLFGGETAISSDVAYRRDGVTRFSNMRLTSPLLTVDEGGGSYGADGEFDITAKGQSDDYGPLALQLTGTVTNPVAVIDAPNPDLGVGLADVTATVRGDDQLYRIEAEGLSDFGAFSGLMRADFSNGPTQYEIASGEVGGIALSGLVTQTQEGPLSGILDAQGKGLDGRIQLASEDGVQVARITAEARNMALPGAAGLRVGRGRAKIRAVLRDQPEITADIQLANARYFGTRIDTARAQIDLVNGQGSAKALASGENGAPFRLAVNADLKPDMWRASVEGTVRGIAVRSETPARLIPASAREDGHYELLPTRFAFDRGKVRLSGRFGSSIELKSRIDALNLGILNRFDPALGVTGKATGSVDFFLPSANAMPLVDADISVARFARSTALTVSEPVDVRFAGQIRERQAEGRAVIRQGGDVVGRIHTQLSPRLGDDGDWVKALLEAPLDGGVRYTGSAATVFSLAGLADQELNGALGIAADLSGQLVQPSLDGVLRGRDLTYENLAYGTRLSGLNARGRFSGDELILEQLEARAGNGRVSAKGKISLAAEQGFPMAIDMVLDNAQLARSQALGATATGNLTITKVAGQRGLLSGTLTLPETRYTLRNQAVLEVPELEGVRFSNGNDDALEAPGPEIARQSEPGFEDVNLDIRIKARNEVFVTGLGLQSEWGADLRVTGSSAAPRLSGQVELIRGTLDFAGRAFDIERGRVRFLGGETFDPRISISATEQIRDVTVTVKVEGSAFSPQFEFASTPGLPQDEILARILFGSSIANLSALEAVQLAQSLNTLSGSGGGLNPLGALRSSTGIDRLRLLAADEATGQGTALAAGQYISDDIYVEVVTDARGFTATQLEISLSRTLSVLSQASGVGGTNVNLRYRKDY